MKKVLIIAYYFPPLAMGGTQRAAKFVKYLPKFGWSPVVVTVKDIAYFAKDESLLKDVEAVQIERTGSLDPQRLLSVFSIDKSNSNPRNGSGQGKWRWLNKLFSAIFIPDSKVLWMPFAFLRAHRLLKKQKIDCLITTAPPHSAHLTGLLLKHLTGIPWVADFRDGWSGGNFQNEPTKIHTILNRFWEKRVLKKADQVIGVSAKLTRKLMTSSLDKSDKFHTITNGFDSEDISNLNGSVSNPKFTIAYCGAISQAAPIDDFLHGLSQLLLNRPELREQLLVNLVGLDLNGNIKESLCQMSLKDVVKFKGYVPHRQALENMFAADLLLYPVSKWASDDFIPGKTFEYLASGKPVLVIGPEIEGVEILKTASQVAVVDGGNSEAVAAALLKLYEAKGSAETHSENLEKFERKNLTKELAQILDGIV